MAKKIKSPYKAWRRYRNRENTCTTLHKVFDYATTNYAKRIAYQFVDGGQQYTYADFRTKTERLSQRMSRFGIKHGDRVAIFLQQLHKLALLVRRYASKDSIFLQSLAHACLIL